MHRYFNSMVTECNHAAYGMIQWWEPTPLDYTSPLNYIQYIVRELAVRIFTGMCTAALLIMSTVFIIPSAICLNIDAAHDLPQDTPKYLHFWYVNWIFLRTIVASNFGLIVSTAFPTHANADKFSKLVNHENLKLQCQFVPDFASLARLYDFDHEQLPDQGERIHNWKSEFTAAARVVFESENKDSFAFIQKLNNPALFLPDADRGTVQRVFYEFLSKYYTAEEVDDLGLMEAGYKMYHTTRNGTKTERQHSYSLTLQSHDTEHFSIQFSHSLHARIETLRKHIDETCRTQFSHFILNYYMNRGSTNLLVTPQDAAKLFKCETAQEVSRVFTRFSLVLHPDRCETGTKKTNFIQNLYRFLAHYNAKAQEMVVARQQEFEERIDVEKTPPRPLRRQQTRRNLHHKAKTKEIVVAAQPVLEKGVTTEETAEASRPLRRQHTTKRKQLFRTNSQKSTAMPQPAHEGKTAKRDEPQNTESEPLKETIEQILAALD